MFLKRGEPDQTFVIPGSLRRIADGAAVTDAELTLVVGGKIAPAAGKLEHARDGCFSYTPTVRECSGGILGYILTGGGALPVCGSVRVEYPSDIGSVGGVPVTPSAGPIPADVTRWMGGEIRPDSDPPETVTVDGDGTVPEAVMVALRECQQALAECLGKLAAQPAHPANFSALDISEEGGVRLQSGQIPDSVVVPCRFPEAGAEALATIAKAADSAGRLKTQPMDIRFGLTARAE